MGRIIRRLMNLRSSRHDIVVDFDFFFRWHDAMPEADIPIVAIRCFADTDGAIVRLPAMCAAAVSISALDSAPAALRRRGDNGRHHGYYSRIRRVARLPKPDGRRNVSVPPP